MERDFEGSRVCFVVVTGQTEKPCVLVVGLQQMGVSAEGPRSLCCRRSVDTNELSGCSPVGHAIDVSRTEGSDTPGTAGGDGVDLAGAKEGREGDREPVDSVVLAVDHVQTCG